MQSISTEMMEAIIQHKRKLHNNNQKIYMLRKKQNAANLLENLSDMQEESIRNDNNNQINDVLQNTVLNEDQESDSILDSEYSDNSIDEGAFLEFNNTEQNIIYESPDTNQYIYSNSNIKYEEFLLVFFTLAQRLKLDAVGNNLLIQFIKSILPADNIIPNSYYKLCKELNLKSINKIRRQYICVYCNDPLITGETCNKVECLHFKNLKVNLSKIDPYYIQHDYLKQFNIIISKNWHEIIKYRENLKKSIKITDICNGNNYKNQELSFNSVCILLFVDAANFTKSSVKNNLYAILGLIIDMPPSLRNSYLNLIMFLFWGGHIQEFSRVMDVITPNIKTFFNHEQFIESLNMKIKVYLFAIIADAPARAKIFNTTQYNGYFGCLHCMNEGESINGKIIYKYTNDPIRTNDMYLDQVADAIAQNSPYEGIKGACYFSEYVSIPNAAIIDYMHLCLEGTFKSLLDLWFNSNNHTKPYYLGNSLNQIDVILLQIKFPTEYSRTQRSIRNWNIYKANEYKNLIMNCGVYVFSKFLPDIYFKHFLSYFLFLRILTSDNIEMDKITYASTLINKFVHDFEDLYGQSNLKYNLHAHLHLPAQVWRYGPLNKLSCFPFEGFFKICHSLFFGTRGIGEQILKNHFIRQQLYFMLDVSSMIFGNPQLESYWNNLTKNINYAQIHQNNLLPPINLKRLDELDNTIEKELIASVMLNLNDQIKTSFSIIFSRRSKLPKFNITKIILLRCSK